MTREISAEHYRRLHGATTKPGKLRGKARRESRNLGMNKLEERYACVLQSELLAGRIKAWAYEAEKLRLADGAWYTPDFRVVMPTDEVCFHEAKGFFREAARVRLKVAAE